MKVLIIEDSSLKLNEIKNFFAEVFPDWDIHDSQSYTAAMRRILSDTWDYLILDMTLPNYDSDGSMNNDNMESLAGSMIVGRMMHRHIIIPTIIITRFETFGVESIGLKEINKMMTDKYSSIWKGTIYYDETTGEWQEKLKQLLMEQEK